MNQAFSASKIAENVYWVGAIDWTIRDFHGYATQRGTTYNAYLILDEKPTLIDTVKGPFQAEMMARIASVIDPSKIAYIVSNHAELDHTQCLPQVIDAVKPEKVFASAKGAEALNAHFHWEDPIQVVKEGETLSLGAKTLAFMETRMLHWPDSMFSFLVEDGILFSQDGFGMHLATTERFADEIDDGILEFEGAKYFANILLPYAQLIPPVLKKAGGLDIRMIAPDHGPVWRKDLDRITGLYARWAAQKPSAKALIVFDTMWGSTEKMARAIEDGLVEAGVSVLPMRLREHHRSNVATELLDAAALIVGSPTLNNNMFPTVADVLTYLKGLRPKNKVAAAFGSYGWSKGVVGQVAGYLTDMGCEMEGEGLAVQYVPDNEALGQCRELGLALGRRIQEKVT